jgi:hypothetical protein
MQKSKLKIYIIFAEKYVTFKQSNSLLKQKTNFSFPIETIKTRYKMRKVFKETPRDFIIKNKKQFISIPKNYVYQVITIPENI